MQHHGFPVISLQVSKDRQEIRLPMRADSPEGEGSAVGKMSHSGEVEIRPSWIL